VTPAFGYVQLEPCRLVLHRDATWSCDAPVGAENLARIAQLEAQHARDRGEIPAGVPYLPFALDAVARAFRGRPVIVAPQPNPVAGRIY